MRKIVLIAIFVGAAALLGFAPEWFWSLSPYCALGVMVAVVLVFLDGAAYLEKNRAPSPVKHDQDEHREHSV